MSDRLTLESESVGDQYSNIAFDENPHMIGFFNKNREIVHCNPTTLRFFDAASAAEMNAKFYGLNTVSQPDGRNSLAAFLQRFNEAEAHGWTEFEFVFPRLTRKADSTNVQREESASAHIIIKLLPHDDDHMFIVTGYNLTTLRGAELRLARQDTYLNALDMIGEVLLTDDPTLVNEPLNNAVAIIGNTFDASQVSICELVATEEGVSGKALCSWHRTPESAGTEPAYCLYLPKAWLESLTSGNFVYRRYSATSGADRVFLQRNSLHALMITPVAKKNMVWGYIILSYDESERIFSESCNNAMSSIAKLLSSCIMQRESTALLRTSLDTNRAILEANPINNIMFDEDANVLDCNLSARNFFQLGKQNISQRVIDTLDRMIPEDLPEGCAFIPIRDRLKTALERGSCEFNAKFIAAGKALYYRIIMNRVIYKDKTAIATYMFNLTSEKEIQLSLQYNDTLLDSLGKVSNLLLTTDVTDLEATILDAMGLIGRAAAVDRVFVWKNHIGEDGRLYTTQIFEWSPEFEPQQSNEFTISIPYDEVIPSWQESLQKGQSLNLLVKNASPEERAQLAPQGIVSLLMVPIFLHDKFWGFIGFDDCCTERIFSSIEENVLRICGFMTMIISDTIQSEIAMHLLAEREAALISAQVKTNFLANMSHEIRTPMNAILGMAELILHEEAADTVISHATDIRNACRGLLAIINDILDISKIESGKLEIIPSRYHISSLLMDVISIIKARADKQSLAFVVNIDTSIPSELIGDEMRIKQILINILHNAVKFTHEGQIALSVNSRITDGVCHLTFAVADTGIGIKSEDMQKIFVLFEQVDTKRNRGIEGTGLGLHISKQLTEMMGGTIEMESEYGVGSTFTLNVPQTIADEQPLAALKHPERNSVLVYENRTTYLDSIAYTLKSLGCQYTICSNRSDMYRYLDEFSYDYLFVSSLYVNKIQPVASRKQPGAVIVVLNGDGSSYYKGNTISISMPIHCLQIANILNDTLDSSRSNSSYAVNITAPGAKVLVVDDNAVNLKVAVGLLNIYKVHVDTASSGMRAVEMVRGKDYDLIFMDHMMPEMDGIDTTMAIRTMGAKYKNLPIVALTANAVGGVREMFKAEGLDDFLAKPIEMSKLNAILKKWIPEDMQRARTETTIAQSPCFDVPGLNTRKGLVNSGGIPDEYREILALYAADSKKRLEELPRYHKEGDLRALTICVHALKSASANVGADEVSIMAAELEAASKNGDTNYVDANLRRFSDSLSLLLENIRNYLDSMHGDEPAKTKAANLEFLKLAMVEMAQRMDSLDIDGVESTLNELSAYQWDSEISECLTRIKDGIAIFDYEDTEAAVSRLRDICGEE